MSTYNFYQDQKVTVWQRHSFSIEAESEEEALQKIQELKEISYWDSSLSAGSGETMSMCETEEEICPEENGGQATLETYAPYGKKLFDNSKEPVKFPVRILFGSEVNAAYDQLPEEERTDTKINELVAQFGGEYCVRKFDTEKEADVYRQGIDGCMGWLIVNCCEIKR